MKELQLTILTTKDLKRRYDKLKDTRMDRLTEKAIKEGYSIGILHYNRLRDDTVTEWLSYARDAVAMNFTGKRYKIGIFTDLSEVGKDKLYFAFKTKDGVQIAHSLSGCDEEGFLFNC